MFRHVFLIASFFASTSATFGEEVDRYEKPLSVARDFIATHCLDCHAGSDASGGMDVESLDQTAQAFVGDGFDSRPWESMLRRIASRQMPPPDASRPSEDEYESAEKALVDLLDRRAADFPRPGHPESLRRLTRTEYANAIRDLIGLTIDASTMLPPDESSHGFDNITVGELSPMLLSRYVSSAQAIARSAVGRGDSGPIGVTVRVPADRTQSSHVDGLPLGSRGGTTFAHHFSSSGQYQIELKLTRDRDEMVEGLTEPHKIDVLIDNEPVHQFTVKPPPGRKDYTHVDSHLRTRLTVDGGTHQVGITFPRKDASLQQTKRQPFDASYNRHRHPRQEPALFQVSIVGPLEVRRETDGPTGETDGATTSSPANPAIFTCRPSDDADDAQKLKCATQIIRRLARLAYRRPVDDEDLRSPMHFFATGFDEAGFEAGIEAALTSILVNPNFLFRIETDAPEASSGEAYAISDIELASRLSFFLWSSIPDERLLRLAQNNRLHEPETLAAEAARMLADPRSDSLVTNFASQWLYLRNLDSITPDLRLFPDFDDNLRQAFRQETEHLFRDVVGNDLSVLRLIDSDYTFLNERLAQHYDIPHVFGSHFRRVDLPRSSIRGGILRHGSILTVTSYATRTSPTIRGHWVLKNIFGTPPPPPPPNVPNLQEKSTLAATSVRERLAMHRADPACASCHDLMDPVGFALENFDAVGRWRDFDGELAIDSSGSLPDGRVIDDVDALERGILNRPEIFVATLVEKLMTFALGRGIDPDDGPAVRRVVRSAGQSDYQFSAIVKAIVTSEPFLKRAKP